VKCLPEYADEIQNRSVKDSTEDEAGTAQCNNLKILLAINTAAFN
jgi:hypothetical protein